MNILWLVSYLTDCTFEWTYYRLSPYANREHPWRMALVLLLLLPLYLNTTLLPIYNSYLRVFYRFLIFYFMAAWAQEAPGKASLYVSLIWATVYTLLNNIFFGPYLSGIFMGTTLLVPSPFWSQVLASLLIVFFRLLYLGTVSWLLPLSRLENPRLDQVLFVVGIGLVSIYTQESGVHTHSSDFTGYPAEFSIHYILLQLSLTFFLLVFERVRQQTNKEIMMETQLKISQARLENIELQKKGEELLRSLRHDLKNHATTLQLLLARGKIDEAMDYLKTLHQSASLPEGTYSTGNDLLDGLLSQKLVPARDQDIQASVQVDFSKGDFIDPFDLCTLVGNLLDNAIEASLKVEPDQRHIRISGGPSANFLLLRIENAWIPPQEFRMSPLDLLPTSKTNRKEHGFGLRNVRQVLEKYDGNLTLAQKDQSFVATVLIPVDSDPDV